MISPEGRVQSEHLLKGTPATLYHYTTGAGFAGILDSGNLWAGDAECTNDAQELRFGRPELVAALRAEAASVGRGAEPGSALDSRATILLSIADHLQPSGRFTDSEWHSAFIVCLCAEGDRLSQWRGYANRGGYSLGFDSRAIILNEPPTILCRVRYGASARDEMIRAVVAAAAPEPRGHPGVTGYARAGTLAIPALATIKDPAFSEEQEWRLIASGDEGVGATKIRAGHVGPVPYLELPWADEALKEIIVGPGPDQDLRMILALKSLRARGLRRVAVRPSDLSFRG